jgi:hypothetical protein
MTDQEAKLEYLKLILNRLNESDSKYSRALWRFCLLSLVFFVLLTFHPSSIDVFGATVSIPQVWISAIAPLALAFLYLRSILFRVQTAEYDHLADKLSREAMVGKEWKLDRQQRAALRGSMFWYIVEREGCLQATTFLVWTVSLLAQDTFPLPIIGYFVYLLWKVQILPVSILVSIASIIVVLLALTEVAGSWKADLMRGKEAVR